MNESYPPSGGLERAATPSVQREVLAAARRALADVLQAGLMSCRCGHYRAGHDYSRDGCSVGRPRPQTFRNRALVDTDFPPKCECESFDWDGALDPRIVALEEASRLETQTSASGRERPDGGELAMWERGEQR